ncbi:MAG: PQQ-binding-like beta-propeller repeat protein [Myxococcales bacterium]|nr:PQQ-binding-like beta-propeller repeat protein [Myxococcales bacterium]
MRRAIPTLLFALALTACGGSPSHTAFHPSYRDSSEAELASALGRLERFEGEPTLVAYSAKEKKVTAFDLTSGSVLFQLPFEAVQAPLVAGEVVVLSDGARVVGVSRKGGSALFELRLEGRHLVGASANGARVVVALSGETADRAGKLVALEGGRVLWSRALEHPVGVPAHGGALVVVPWAHQNLSFLRAEDGVEVVRTRALGTIVGHTELTPLGLVAGQARLFAVDASLAEDPRVRAERTLGGPALELPGAPTIRSDAYARPEPPTSARHRVRLDAAPTRGERGLVAERNRHYFAFHGVLLGIDGDRLAWALRLDGSVAGLAAVPGGAFVATTEGQVLFVDAAGEVQSRLSLPSPVDVATFAYASAPQGVEISGPRPGRALESFAELARDRNAQLTPVAKLAVAALGASDSPESTAELAILCDETSLSPTVTQAACKALGDRTIGHEGIALVLSRRASFLEGTTAPPVGPLAKAAQKIGDRSVASLLVQHLRDPGTRAEDLADVARALGELGDDDAAEALADFLTLHHAYREDPALSGALVAAADAYAKLRGEAARELLDRLRDDPFTDPALRRALSEPR